MCAGGRDQVHWPWSSFVALYHDKICNGINIYLVMKGRNITCCQKIYFRVIYKIRNCAALWLLKLLKFKSYIFLYPLFDLWYVIGPHLTPMWLIGLTGRLLRVRARITTLKKKITGQDTWSLSPPSSTAWCHTRRDHRDNQLWCHICIRNVKQPVLISNLFTSFL